MTVTVGVDIGGSSVAAVARDAAGRMMDYARSSQRLNGGAEVAEAAVDAVRSLGDIEFAAVGVGVPGQVDPGTGGVSLAVNLGIWAQPYDLAGAISTQVGKPVVVENDVRTAAMGMAEVLRLQGRSPQSLALVSVGTGISAGVVSDGVLLRGAHGMAGEIGHVVVDDGGPMCPCGQRGCLETLVAGPAIGRAWPKSDSQEAATALFAAVAAGDPAARTVAERIVGHLTTALTWLAATYDTELMILTGGVADAGDGFLAAIRNQLAQQGAASELAARRLRPAQVTIADPEDLPGPRGAALLAAQSLQRRGVSRKQESKQEPMSKQLGGAV